MHKAEQMAAEHRKGERAMIKLKVSYEQDEELKKLLALLNGKKFKIKEPVQQSGRFRKVYIELKE